MDANTTTTTTSAATPTAATPWWEEPMLKPIPPAPPAFTTVATDLVALSVFPPGTVVIKPFEPATASTFGTRSLSFAPEGFASEGFEGVKVVLETTDLKPVKNPSCDESGDTCWQLVGAHTVVYKLPGREEEAMPITYVVFCFVTFYHTSFSFTTVYTRLLTPYLR